MWMEGHDGTLTATWLGYRVHMSVYIALSILFIFTFLLYLVIKFMVSCWFMPEWFRQYMQQRRQNHLHHHLVEGMKAMALDDHKKLSSSVKSLRSVQDGKFSRMFDAYLAQVSGNLDAAREHYSHMLIQKGQELVGMKGLMQIAMLEGLWMEAWTYSEKIARAMPKATWLLFDQLDIARQLGKWEDVTVIIKKLLKEKSIAEVVYQKETSQALGHLAHSASEYGDYKIALHYAKQALKTDPASLENTILMARIQWQQGDRKAAVKTLKKGWEHGPDEHHIEALSHMFNYGEEKELIKHLGAMSSAADHGMADMAIAKLALKQNNLDLARTHLGVARRKGESLELCLLMIDLEMRDHPHGASVEHWVERAKAYNESSDEGNRNSSALKMVSSY